MEPVRSRSRAAAAPRPGPGFHRTLSPARYRPSFSAHPSSSSSSSAAAASALSLNGLPAGSLSPARSAHLRSLTETLKPKPNSPNNSDNNANGALPRMKPKKTCMCSPTNHPGSFRCSLHRNASLNVNNSSNSRSRGLTDGRRSAMRNSLVRICSVEGDLMLKRALASPIRPSSHQVRRRSDFRPTPSKLSRMTRAEEPDLVLPGPESPP